MARRRNRRKPNTGYTTQAKAGTWNALFPRFGGGYHVRKGFDSRASAEAWLDSLLEQREAKGDVEGGQQKLNTWMDTWATRAAKEREWKAKMIADVEWKLGYVKGYIGDSAIVDILPDHVDAMWDDLRKHLAETTIRQIRNYLYQVFEEAQARKYITYNPVLKPKRRKRPKQKPPQRLSGAQAALLLRKASESFYHLAWWLILILGLRAGEVCGLRWGDIDFQNAALTIAQAMGEIRSKTHRDLPKNDKIRTLAVPRAILALLLLHKKALAKRAAMGLQRGYWQENGLVFPGKSGRPMNPIALRHQLKRMTDAVRLPPVTTHMLRHTAAKFYTDINTPENVKKAILGHTPDITGHYAPPDADAQRPWVEQVYQMLAREEERVKGEKEA